MRVLIELFDKDPIENMLGACVFEPEIVVFLCDRRDISMLKEAAVVRLLRQRRLATQARFLYFDTSDPVQIKRVLAAVVRDYPGCVFDVSGGRDLVLLQAGAYCLPREVPCYFIDIPRGRFINVQHCEGLAANFCIPKFTAEDIFALTGANIVGSGHYDKGELTQAFEQQVMATWQLVEFNTKAWGDFVSYLQALSAGTSMQTLTIRGLKSIRGMKFNPGIVEHLHKNGLITQYAARGKEVHLTFQSALVKKCLLNQGVWLELYCYVTAKRGGYFDDVRTSTVVDWAAAQNGQDTTRNEVDVLLVKGIVPVFVSCKMSAPSPLALSEIRLLSAKFGGALSRTVVVTGTTLGADHRSLRMRAEDLDIRLIDMAVIRQGGLVAQLERAVNQYR